MPIALYLLLRSSAEDLQHRSLRENADLIIRYLTVTPDGRFGLSLPPKLEALFSESYGRYAYSVVDSQGRALFSSLKGRTSLFSPDDEASFPIYVERRRGEVGASIPVTAGGRQVWVQISQDMEHRDVLIDDIVREFFARVGWITIPILLFLLIIDVTIFRRALRPLLNASELAGKIGPERTDVRLPLETIPSEIKQLVGTINQALDRLDQGFRVQRDFTADAAHELRTPLSILQARVDTLPDRAIAKELSRDIDRMKRVVSQLLDIAELDAFTVKPAETADLKAVCVEVVEFFAPIAIAEGKYILLEAPDELVLINGDEDVLFRALRNLVENAIRYTPVGMAVTIDLQKDGSLLLSDQGPGIAASDRDHIFQRFWRKDRSGSAGSGLGLAIVKRIMDAHHARISVGNLTPNGCIFKLQFELVPAAPS